MKLEKFVVKNFRSIKEVEILFPENIPVILFGPNNVGKSNILKAMDCLLGEKYASYIDFQDSDYHLRDKAQYSQISFSAYFDEEIKTEFPSSSSIHFATNHEFYHYKDKAKENLLTENVFHYENGDQMFLKNEDKEKCQFILIDATRDIGRQLSYYSQYSILSKMSKKMHASMQSQVKTQLDEHFEKIKETFDSVPEYKLFHEKLQDAFRGNIDGFEHKLEIDLSAYDPNNYFHSLRIVAKENGAVRAFEEFGTGEQQILLMSFVKAYAETFKNENFILGIEEPESHLHPIAQRWLSQNIKTIAESNVQVVLTTHSPEFLDIDNLEGFVKVFRDGPITKALQHNRKSLKETCLKLKSSTTKTKEENILSFYRSKTFYDQLRGFFARKIILVEGETEFFSLPNYFKKSGYDLIKNGVEIVNCRGKNQITRNYRLFKTYCYECFCLFDADAGSGDNEDLAATLDFDKGQMTQSEEKFAFDEDKKYGYFGKNFETYMRKNFTEYEKQENQLPDDKVLKAKIISEDLDLKPDFIEKIALSLDIVKDTPDNPTEEVSLDIQTSDDSVDIDEVPF